MTNPNYTHMTLVVDRSGSMGHLSASSSKSINDLFKEQAAQPGEMTATLYQFDTVYEKVFGPTPVQNAPAYYLEARGGTALYDSVFRAITETGEFLKNLPEHMRPSKVVFTIVTDGAENSSREVNLATVKKAIEHQTETYKWEFVFLASGIDAFSVGTSMGIFNNAQMSASDASYGLAYASTSASISAFRGGAKSIAENFVTDHRDPTDGSTLSWTPPQQGNVATSTKTEDEES